MKYYCTYGVNGCEMEELCVSGNQKAVNSFLYESSVEIYQSFEGLHGIRSIQDIALDEYDVDWDVADEDVCDLIEAEYNDEIEDVIEYSFVEFDEKNMIHADALAAQEGEFWEV